MRFLLDTHTIIWFFNGDKNLSETAKQEILNSQNKKYVSIASVWELAIKISLEKLLFHGGTKEFINLIENNGFNILPISQGYILTLEKLPYFHRDPFDRIIISTAITEKMSILTTDKSFLLYDSKCIW